METTLFTSSILTLFYIFLALRIGYLRGSPVMKLIFQKETNGTDAQLERNVRAHGNFIEYVPLFLILLMLSEYNAILSEVELIIASFVFWSAKAGKYIFHFAPPPRGENDLEKL